jgi:poly-beta-1,6-N-acetyl-D-glucosamine synthase
MSDVWTFLLIWGVWLVTPVLVDGIDTVSRLFVVWTRQRQRRNRVEVTDDELPTVSIIVPAHNEAEVIDRCLHSIKGQDYPHDKLEIIVVDDGSTDDTAEIVENHVVRNGSMTGSIRLRGQAIRVGPYHGTLTLIRNGHGGKSAALNAGIAASTGEIVINIDSDVVLEPGAVCAIAKAFVRDPDMGAATGNIEVDWDLIEERDANGDLVLDENGDMTPKRLGPIERFLAKSQFLEYLASFDLGRRAQAILSTMYTLAGACSAFRRDVLLESPRYSSTTVSEDTDLTFDLHRRGVKVGFVEDARVYLEPVVKWDALYAQRARWARGQLEVCGLNEEIVGRREHGTFGFLTVPKMLLFDHTLAFPRMIWTPLLLCFPLIGYSWRIIGLAVLGMYVFYLGLEIVSTISVYTIADKHTRERIEHSVWMLFGLPVYRFVVFHFRFSGFLMTLTEQQQWTVSGPVGTARADARALRVRSLEVLASLSGAFAHAGTWFLAVAQHTVAPALIGLTYGALEWLAHMRRI